MYEFLIQCYLSESCIKTYTLLDAYDGFTGIALKMEAFEKLSCAVYTYIYKHTKKYYWNNKKNSCQNLMNAK